MNYYYLAASLPTVAMDRPPLLTEAAFLEVCQAQLKEADFAALVEVLNASFGESRHPFASEWNRRETALRNALVKLRATRVKREAAAYLREPVLADGGAERAAQLAMAQENPVERELALDRYRWAVLDEMAGYDPFSLSAVIAYGMKLKMAARWAAMDEKAGRERAEAVISRKPDANKAQS